jgi:thiosulfate/3-mercaptopyruvate sulfurtransferase
MSYETIIDRESACDHFDDPDWVFVDCRFVIREPDRGEREYAQAHISKAVYAHLDRDLSGPIIPGRTGRHPLPAPLELARTFSRWGIGATTQVVAYDESTGAMAAARLWWLLKWAGHDAAAVLDGGFRRWCAAGLSYSTGPETNPAREFEAKFRPRLAMEADELLNVLDDPAWVVLDARAADRYQGIGETMDPVAGHIKGAFSAPYVSSLAEDGTFKTPQELAKLFDAAMRGRDASHTVEYCGSGVTAAHSVLASAHAGKGMPRLYPGSWSEWILDPARPVVKGGKVSQA